jgi:hypothetical protein
VSVCERRESTHTHSHVSLCESVCEGTKSIRRRVGAEGIEDEGSLLLLLTAQYSS